MATSKVDKKRQEKHKPRRLTVYIDIPVKEQIEEIAAVEKRTVSAHVQMIFEDYLKDLGSGTEVMATLS